MNIEKILLENSATPSRREFLKTSGMLVVGFSAAAVASPFAAQSAAQAARGLYPDPDFRQLDSWIVIHQDNTATFYVGKTDCGQGTGTAFRQMMSDELDIAFTDTTCVMGTTDITVDQGGSGGSDAIQVDGWPMRRVAAEARRVLLDMASERFGVPVAGLAVSNAVITVKADPSKRVTYGELIGGKKKYSELAREEGMVDLELIEMIERDIVDAAPKITFDNIAGLEHTKQLLQEAVMLPQIAPHLFKV